VFHAGWLRRSADDASTVTVFMSSGSDVQDIRDEFEHMVGEANKQLTWAGSPLHIRLQRWEDSPPQRADGAPNARFKDLASKAHLTLVLLNDDIRSGTQEELEAALASPDVQVAVVWTGNPTSRKGVKLRRYLEARKDLFVWEKTGPPGSEPCRLSLLGIVANLLIYGLSVPQVTEPLYEQP
jgi:hypothetical protein